MREKIQMYICLQLSLFLHYGLLTCVAAEVQGQSIRTNKHVLIQAMNVARRAGINVAKYQNLLNQAPLTEPYENKIEFGRVIDERLQLMGKELNDQLQRQADWKIYYRHDPAILVVDTTNPNLLDSWVFIYRDGYVERHWQRFVSAPPGPGHEVLHAERPREAVVAQTCRLDHLSPALVAELFAIGESAQLDRIPRQNTGSSAEAGSVWIDFHGKSSPDLLGCRSGSGKDLLAFYQQISKDPCSVPEK